MAHGQLVWTKKNTPEQRTRTHVSHIWFAGKPAVLVPQPPFRHLLICFASRAIPPPPYLFTSFAHTHSQSPAYLSATRPAICNSVKNTTALLHDTHLRSTPRRVAAYPPPQYIHVLPLATACVHRTLLRIPAYLNGRCCRKHSAVISRIAHHCSFTVS